MSGRRVYLLRHGQTTCTLAGRFCGRHDPPLTEVGRAMAVAFARAHADPPWRSIVSSPARRARETAAQVAAALDPEIAIDDGLAELDYGAWDDRPQAEVSPGPAFQHWREDPARRAPPGGETAQAVLQRALAAVERALARSERVLLISHKAPIRILVCHWLGIDLSRFRDRVSCPVTSLTEIELGTRGARLGRLASVCHLPPPWQMDPDHAARA